MQAQRLEESPGVYEQLRRFFLSSIRTKIILPYLVLTIVVAIIGVFVVTRLVASSLDERLSNQLLEAGRVVSDGMARREIEHLESARAIAFTKGLNEALAEGDRESAWALAQPVVVLRGLESSIVVDAAGREVLHMLGNDGSYEFVEGSSGTSELWMVRSLLEDGDPNAMPKRGLVFHSSDGRYYYFTAIPVGLDDRVVGVVVVGTSLDTLLSRFKATALADVIIYLDGGHAVDTTFAFGESPDAVDALLEELSITPAIYRSALFSSDYVSGEGIQVRGRLYRLARGSLRVGPDAMGVFAVALPLNFVIEGYTIGRNTYTLLFAAGMLGVVLLGYLISQRITNPLGRLVRTSRAVAEGNLEQRTGIVSADEIGILAGTFDEMTGRLAERTARLEETLGRMQAILSSMGDGVMMEDLDGRLITLNAAADGLLEEMAEGFLLGPLRDLGVDEYDQAMDTQSSPWLADNRRFEVGQKVISAHSATVRTEEGTELGTVIVMRDVTAEVEAERLKDGFITHVSHELRTPLTAIKGYSDLMLSGVGGTLEEAQQDFLQTIGRNADDLIAMVNELLDFSEMEASGRLGVVKRPMDVSALVEEVAEEWRPRMEEKSLGFEVDLSADLPLVEADNRRLRWAMIHLIRNAIQYTPSKGNVTLRLVERNGHVVLDVVDTGIGISEEDRDNLFSRFYRVTNMPEDEVRGLGVGLYLAQAIVEAHGGEIVVDSELGVGSTFSIILPALPENEVA
jgi:signal transduction histidine kinase